MRHLRTSWPRGGVDTWAREHEQLGEYEGQCAFCNMPLVEGCTRHIPPNDYACLEVLSLIPASSFLSPAVPTPQIPPHTHTHTPHPANTQCSRKTLQQACRVEEARITFVSMQAWLLRTIAQEVLSQVQKPTQSRHTLRLLRLLLGMLPLSVSPMLERCTAGATQARRE